MRLCLRSRLLTVALALLSFSYVAGESWQKYVSEDGAFSFHYPRGWKVAASESAIEISNPSNHEQLLLVAVPFDAGKSPRQLAEDMIAIFRSGTPDLRASDWKPVGSADVAVHFKTKYTENGQKFDADVGLVKEQEDAFWFSYSALLAGYDSARALALLDGMAGSFARGSESRAPSSVAGPARQAGARASEGTGDSLEKNAKAFLFVLEFALGAPLTSSQEKVILTELLKGWRSENPAELRKFDQYPTLVKVILKLGQSDLESTRSELEKSTREWIEDYRGKSPSVVIIENELQRRGKVLVPAAEPPLTEMAAAAYSEIMAYSELLNADPGADVSQIPGDGIAQYRRRVTTQWAQLSRTDRDLIATTPGLWLCLRTLINHGDQTEQRDTRALIRRLTVDTSSGSSSSSGGQQASGKSAVDAMLKHNVLMNIQQQTFNQYMWSRGFNYSPVYGKMW